MQQGFPATEGGGEREEMGRELGGSGGGHGEVGGEGESYCNVGFTFIELNFHEKKLGK